jgi:hypothetical protein
LLCITRQIFDFVYLIDYFIIDFHIDPVGSSFNLNQTQFLIEYVRNRVSAKDADRQYKKVLRNRQSANITALDTKQWSWGNLTGKQGGICRGAYLHGNIHV